MYNTQIRENEILFSQEGELIRLTPCGRNAIRFQTFPGGRVLDENYNLMPRETEAEIIDAVKCGHTTVDGVKFHTRAGMGRCQGGFCSAKILEIISRESGIPMQELTKRGANSRIISGQLGSIEVKL